MQRHNQLLQPMQQSGYDPLLNIAISSQSLNQPFDYLKSLSKRSAKQRQGRTKSRQTSGKQQMSDFAILSRVRIRRNHRCQTAKATVADDTLQNQQSMPHALVSAQYNRQLQQERQSYDGAGFRNS